MSSANDDGEKQLKEAVSKNETLAEWGGAAVVFGLVVEVVLTASYRHGDSIIEAWGPVFADALIALGVAAEILFARKARSKAEALQRRSDERIAEANARAAEARERTAQVEKLTAWRRVSPEQHRQISDAVRGELTPSTDVHIESERGDPEAFSYAFDIHKIFKEAGVKEVSGGSNSWLGWQKFGLYAASSPGLNLSLIIEAFRASNINLNVGGLPFGLPTVSFPRALYIFVAPKLPPRFEEFAKPGDSERASSASENTTRESNI